MACEKPCISIPPSIYFGGCCFGGVHAAMVEKWGADFYKHTIISGGSAGTIIAIAVALGKTPKETDDMYRKVAEPCYKLGPIRNASIYCDKALRSILDPLAHVKLEGKCFIGSTAFFSRHRWHISWDSLEDLIECCNASIHIPFYCHRIKPLHGVEVVDGAYGFAGIDLTHGDETLYVGIDPHAEITRHFTYEEMFFPCIGEKYDAMVQSGYDAFMAWDGKMMAKVGKRLPNYSALYVLWALKMIEVAVFFVYDWLAYLLDSLLSLLGLFKATSSATQIVDLDKVEGEDSSSNPFFDSSSKETLMMEAGKDCCRQ